LRSSRKSRYAGIGLPIRSIAIAIEETNLSIELLVALDRDAREPLRAQLEQRLREAIRSGRLAPGTRLPSSRGLARDLGVSRGLVVDCYEQLRAEGYLSALTGFGTTVAFGAIPAPGAQSDRPALTRVRYDLRPAAPDLASFPRRDWSSAIRRAIGTLPDSVLDYGDPRGAADLRRELAGYLGRVRGAHADPERIVVCAGFAQARNLVFRALRARGATRVAFEDPSQPQSRQAAAHAGIEAVPASVDQDGVRVEAVRATRADAMVLTPAHQFPTGVLLAPERRRELLTWAREAGAYLVEDDYDAEFRYDRDPVGALQGLAPDRVIYAGSVSKALAPALRLGWLLCPPELIDEITEVKRAEDLGSAVLEQHALATLIASGAYDRHLRRARPRYRRRRNALLAALRQHVPEIELRGIAAGIHVVAMLPDRIDEKQLINAAADRSVGLHGMSTYRFSLESRPPALVLGYGSLTEHAIGQAIASISDLITTR
jgi:GntR family transcriptional regulator/MocR family aminotransferase